MTDKKYFDELEKNRVEMVPKGKIEDSITIPEQRNVLDFCLKDEGFKEAYVKSGSKKSFEVTLKWFIKYLYCMKNNPIIKMYYMKDRDKVIKMMDMKDVLNLYVKYINVNEELDKLLEANKKGEKVAGMIKTYEERKIICELNRNERADLIKYCKDCFNIDFAENEKNGDGVIFPVNEGSVYDEDKQAINVNGEFLLISVDEEKNITIPKVLFDNKTTEQYGNKRKKII